MTLSNGRVLSALVVFVVAFTSACGSDSTGPSAVDSNGALQSLALGFQGVDGFVSPTTPDITPSLSTLAPLLDQVNVTIDGTARTMFALGLRESFPAGTCAETLFIDPQNPPAPGLCTPPLLGVALILWQSHAATAVPDRIILVLADVGTNNFDFSSALPGFALYIEGQDNVWNSLSGNLTTEVAGTGQTCNLPLPPYAKSGTCSVATFAEQGSIVFEPFLNNDPDAKHLTVVIPHQTLDGLWQSVTEVQSAPLSGNRIVPGLMGMRRLSRVAPRLTPVR